MGLDQNAYYCKPQSIGTAVVDFGQPEDAKDFFYWRKHPNLQGWMRRLYEAKGGKEEFNCVPVLLTEADLSELELDILRGALPHTNGFFFGSSRNDEDEQERDLQFIRQARELIVNGSAVFYSSWW
jgi:hypothetical protein